MAHDNWLVVVVSVDFVRDVSISGVEENVSRVLSSEILLWVLAYLMTTSGHFGNPRVSEHVGSFLFVDVILVQEESNWPWNWVCGS